MAVLAVSGMAQMPVFKRYHIADVPGMAWTADAFFSARLHYVAAGVLLFWLARRLVLSGARPFGAVRLTFLGLLAATGAARVTQNLPQVDFSPMAARYLDWTHLATAILLGIWALAAVALRRVNASHTARRLP
jgi:hypothetical protein